MDERHVGARTDALKDLAARAENLLGRAVAEHAAVELVARLQDAGVQPLLLKGPVLARLLYHPGEHRGYYDVDVLVAPECLERTRATLRGLGYEDRSAPSGVDNFLGVVHAHTWIRPQAAAIDLHWRLPGCEAPPATVWAALYAGRTSIEIDGHAIAAPGVDALALHLALHAAGHGLKGLKALGDLRRGLERWSPEVWSDAARLAETLQATPSFAAGLRLLPEGAVMAQQLGLTATDQLSWTILHRQQRPRGTFHVTALQEAQGWAQRADILRRSLFPRRAWIARQFRWARRGRPSLAAGYVVHLLRSPLWAARAWWFARRARRAGTPPGR